MQKLENTIVPSLIAGAAGAGIYFLMYGNPGVNIPLGPLELPSWAAVGATVAIGNVGGEILTQYILPLIPKVKDYQSLEEMVVPPALAGVSTYLAMRFLVSENTELIPALAVGTGGSIGGKYIYGMI
jgi:hypothetical protein